MSNQNISGSPGTAEDEELTLPRASINKMIKELVPSVRIANEARELVLNCCTEFIHLLSSEANEILLSCATVENIEVISSITAAQLNLQNLSVNNIIN